MKWLIGILVAPRPVPSIAVTLKSLRSSWKTGPYCFAEPGCEKALEGELCSPILRPSILWGAYNISDWAADDDTGRILSPRYEHSPEGVFGNFQNWLQSAADLVQLSKWQYFEDSDAIMICEDDAQFTEDIRTYVESHLWPSPDCGVVSLYCPPMSQYRPSRTGIAKTNIIHSGAKLTGRNNLCGALALIFPRKVLAELINHPSQTTWGGSHAQTASGVNPWERKAVDTWIGRALLEMGRTCWHFTPSLVNHYAPQSNVSNSSMGNGLNRSKRQASGWKQMLGRTGEPGEVFAEVK